MKALDIYQQDISQREAGTALPRQSYYIELRDALHQELIRQGYSDLLETLLLDSREGKLERIYVADYAALMECHSMIVLGRPLRDATEFVPHLKLRGERARWRDLEQPGSFLMPMSRAILDKLVQLRSVSRQLVDARDDTVIPQAGDAAQREVEQVHTLNKMLDERCRALQAERDELQIRLRQAEEGLISEQVRYAIEARRIQEEEALRRNAERQQEAASAAFRAGFAKEQADFQVRREEEERVLSALRQEAAKEHEDFRRELQGELQSLTDLMTEKAAAWDRNADRAEYRMLAASYVSLHGLLTGEMAELTLTAHCEGASGAVLEAAANLETRLRERLRQLEQAMARLGLIVLRPAKGDVLDGRVHVPSGLSAGAVGDARVKRCVHPGVMIQGAREALIRAEVETE